MFRVLYAVRDVEDGGGSGKRSLRNEEEGGRLLYLSKKKWSENLFGFIGHFITARGKIEISLSAKFLMLRRLGNSSLLSLVFT